MNTANYWKKCRLYRLPDKAVINKGLNPTTWTYLIPTSAEGTQLGSFPILSVTKKKRHEIKAIYQQKNITMHNKQYAENDIYWLFELGNPLDNMPQLKNIKPRAIVMVGENPIS